jgi:hypothetical protein
MSLTPGSFRPSELADADQTPSDADLAAAYSMARELEASIPAEGVHHSSGFADRVMAAIATEPAPRRSGFLAPLRDRPGLAGLVASVREAWTVAVGAPGRAAGARGLALAYVLAILLVGTSLTGLAAYGTAGALGLLDGDPSTSPSVEPSTVPSPTPTADPSLLPSPEPTASPTASPSETPTASVEPSESPEASDDDGDASASPDASPDDDDDASPSPDASDDSGGSDDDAESIEPADTPRPSDTPKPSQTPN